MLIAQSRRSRRLGLPWGLEFSSASFVFDIFSAISIFFSNIMPVQSSDGDVKRPGLRCDPVC